MKKLIVLIVAVFGAPAYAATYFCDSQNYLVNLETEKQVRKVNAEEGSCRSILTRSKSGFYCDADSNLVGLESGSVVRKIYSELEGSCDEVLRTSKGGFYCDEVFVRSLEKGHTVRTLKDCARIFSESVEQ